MAAAGEEAAADGRGFRQKAKTLVGWDGQP
jgi:hypothetical protein